MCMKNIQNSFWMRGKKVSSTSRIFNSLNFFYNCKMNRELYPIGTKFKIV